MKLNLKTNGAVFACRYITIAEGLGAYLSFGGRTLIALLFLISGALKAANPGATVDYIASVGLPFPLLSLIGAIAVELGGGMALLVGYQTRLVAAGLAGFTIITALIFHNQLADQNQLNHFLKNFAIAGGLLYIVAVGAGGWSVDARSTNR